VESAESVVETQPSAQTQQADDCEAHHREVVTVDSLYDRCTVSLDSIRTGLVQRLTSSDVSADFRRGKWSESDSDLFDVRENGGTLRGGNGGHNGVGTAAEPSQHRLRVFAVARLAQRVTVNYDDSVSREHDGIMLKACDCCGFR
jgi:hypothetical protein